jgi:3-methyladenine DNA glycosylase/8-oxoguanine DNA glycosylase
MKEAHTSKINGRARYYKDLAAAARNGRGPVCGTVGLPDLSPRELEAAILALTERVGALEKRK